MINYVREKGFYMWAVELQGTGEVIGLLNQCNNPDRFFRTMELGYAIGKPHWGKGYTTEALKAVCDFLFSQGIPKICCKCIKENKASARVMEKAGFSYEGLSVKEIYYHDRYWDLLTYYRLNPLSD